MCPEGDLTGARRATDHRFLIRIIPLALLALAALGASGLARAQEKLPVVVTSALLKPLVEAVGGERVEVEALAGRPKAQERARLRRAALVVRMGLDHEPWLAALKLRAPVVDASRKVRLLSGHTHYALDPHNAEPITASILAALIRASPGDEALFLANRDAFLVRLNQKLLEWDRKVHPWRGTAALAVDDRWAYFAERFGLRIVAVAVPDPAAPPAAAELAALARRAKQAGAKLVLADPHADPALVRRLAARSGAAALTLLPLGEDYFGLFDENVGRLVKALAT